MSHPPQTSESTPSCSKGLPAWISSGVLGLVIGAGGTLLFMQGLHPEARGGVPVAAGGNPAPATPTGAGGMGGMPGGGGRGGGGGAGGKRALTSLVGKLELLSRPQLQLHVELSADQAKSIAAKLTEFEKSEAMSAEEAQENLDALESLLTPEQKEIVNAIGLPQGRGGGGRGGGGGGGGAPATSGPPGGGGGGMMGGGNPTENPFTQEANQKRLRDLLTRLAPDAA